MRIRPQQLINTAEIELWPAWLVSARSNADARILARARWLLRRKRDGRYLAADLPEGLMPLVVRLNREPGIDAALDALQVDWQRRPTPLLPAQPLPLSELTARLEHLGLEESYGESSGLPLTPEPSRLQLAGLDRYRRPLWLLRPAARAWRHMQAAAWQDGIDLQAISGYRSHAYQLGIFERKRARGLTVEQILAVNAAPGYSEHHSGCALDIGSHDQPPAEESFEHTPAFAWLQRRAGEFGFTLSYPRDNPHGIVYEPWHWCWKR